MDGRRRTSADGGRRPAAAAGGTQRRRQAAYRRNWPAAYGLVEARPRPLQNSWRNNWKCDSTCSLNWNYAPGSQSLWSTTVSPFDIFPHFCSDFICLPVETRFAGNQSRSAWLVDFPVARWLWRPPSLPPPTPLHPTPPLISTPHLQRQCPRWPPSWRSTVSPGGVGQRRSCHLAAPSGTNRNISTPIDIVGFIIDVWITILIIITILFELLIFNDMI